MCPVLIASNHSVCLFRTAAIVAAAASTLEPWVFGTALCLALLVFLTSWRSLLPRKVFEDPATVQINRLPTHSRLQNYPTFEDAVARGQRSPNILSLRYDMCTCGKQTLLLCVVPIHAVHVIRTWYVPGSDRDLVTTHLDRICDTAILVCWIEWFPPCFRGVFCAVCGRLVSTRSCAQPLFEGGVPRTPPHRLHVVPVHGNR